MTNAIHHHQVAHNNNHSSFVTLAIGFIFALGNQIFGVMNTLLDVQSTFWMQWIQALITGGLGALSAYLVNRGLKSFEKFLKRKKKTNGF